jgi:predicted HAD superfamily Cof-like phosphohydrolase
MANVFKDQEMFMQACDQSVTGGNDAQFNMYVKLIGEETGELADAIAADDPVETLDALIDILVVTIGAIHSMGADAEGAWKEVMKTNFAKVHKETGKVNKREDGKVLKPDDWVPPDLAPFVKRSIKNSKKSGIIKMWDGKAYMAPSGVRYYRTFENPDQIKYYYLAHWAGAFGTWLSWFISQHADFPKTGLLLCRTSDMVDRQFWSQEPSRPMGYPETKHFSLSAREYWELETIPTFSDFIKAQPNMHASLLLPDEAGAQNPSPTKMVVRPFNNHSYTLVTEKLKQEQPDPRCIGIITIRTSAKYRPMVARRLMDLKKISYDEAMEFIIEREEAQTVRYNIVKSGALDHRDANGNELPPSYAVDFGKLMEYDQREYQRLCEYLDQPQLPNWQDFVDVANTEIWDRYRTSID